MKILSQQKGLNALEVGKIYVTRPRTILLNSAARFKILAIEEMCVQTQRVGDSMTIHHSRRANTSNCPKKGCPHCIYRYRYVSERTGEYVSDDHTRCAADVEKDTFNEVE